MSTIEAPFLVGTAISVYQNSGGTDTNWSEFEQKRNANGKPTIKGGVACGRGADFWERYEEDIERAASLKLNSFRLSIEWNRLEPKRGKIDEAGIARYHQIFDCLHRCYVHATSCLHACCLPFYTKEVTVLPSGNDLHMPHASVQPSLQQKHACKVCRPDMLSGRM